MENAVVQPAAIIADSGMRRKDWVVVISGLVSTAFALLCVYLLDRSGNNIMGWMGNYIIPIGAIIVGFGASIGYGLASWACGVKIQRRLLKIILVLQILAYFAARYIDFRSQGPLMNPLTKAPLDFFHYFHLTTVKMRFVEKGVTGSPLGAWGYGVRLLELIGFVGGTLGVPLIMSAMPYCDACEVYKKNRVLALFPASVPLRKIKKGDVADQVAFDAEQDQAWKAGVGHLEFLSKCAADNNPTGFCEYTDAAAADMRKVGELPRRLAVDLVHCKSCCSGHLKCGIVTGQGKQTARAELPDIELAPEFVRELKFKKAEDLSGLAIVLILVGCAMAATLLFFVIF